MGSNRDDFSKDTITRSARRVGYRCSCPECRVPTDGPSGEGPGRVSSIGEASHICAASPGGPRYDSSMTPEERKDISNCIWLCKTHAKLIDTDVAKYTVELLRKWKADAEALASSELGKRTGHNNPLIPKCLTRQGPLNPEIDLVGRDDTVKKVRSMLDQRACISLVSGLGGIGKTAVMQKVYDSIYKDGIEQNHVAWITCGGSLEDDLLTMRDAFGVPKEYNREDAYAAVVQAMKTFPGTLYMFMDDMARMPGVAEMRSLTALGPNMKIMITSRHGITGISPKSRIDLFVLAEDDALEMFYRYYQRDIDKEHVEDARKIIESDSVRRHTLLMELIAKAANRSFDTLDVFRRNLEKKGFFEVSSAELSSNHDDENLTIEESVIKLYEISGLNDKHKRIMNLFSIFTPERVIYGKVVEWAGIDENDVEELVKLGWLARTEGGYVIHQIVKDSIARQVGDGLKIEEYGELLKKVADADSYMPRTLEYSKVRERLVLAEDVARYTERRRGSLLKTEKGSVQNASFLKDSSILFNNIASVYREQGDYAKALEYYEKALQINERVLGSGHPSTATTYSNMAVVYREQGDNAKALEYCKKALEIRERVLGSGHPDTAATYNNMANVYSSQGDNEKALEYYKKALEIRERVLGSGHPDTAATYNNMANVYCELGDYGKALEYYEKAFKIRERVLGSNHPDTAATYNNMANVYREQGDYGKALEYYKKALEIRERVLGSNHPDTAATYNNIALVYCAQGDYGKALEYYEKALEISECVLGRDHPLTATMYNNKASVYSAQGDYGKALEYYEKALEIRERVLGSGHLNTATTYHNIALVYHAQGDYEKALKYDEKALEVYRKKLGEDHPYTKTTQQEVTMLKNKLSKNPT